MRAPGSLHASVSMSVGGERLQEYKSETLAHGKGRAATCYVESVPGSEFGVKRKLGPRLRNDSRMLLGKDDCLNLVVYLDGKYAAGSLCPQRNVVTRHGSATILDSAPESVGGISSRRKFKFAELKTTDSQPDPTRKHKFAELGQVKVELHRCGRKKFKFKTSGSGHDFSAITNNGEVPEKVLKGQSISTYAELGDAVPSGPHTYCDVDYKYGHEPLATWIFKYRSHRNLQVEGIIPPDVPLEERNPEDLTAEEARELIRRMRAESQTIKIKPDPAAQDEKPAKRQHSIILDDDENNVREGSVFVTASRSKRVKAEIEVVDLTDI